MFKKITGYLIFFLTGIWLTFRTLSATEMPPTSLQRQSIGKVTCSVSSMTLAPRSPFQPRTSGSSSELPVLPDLNDEVFLGRDNLELMELSYSELAELTRDLNDFEDKIRGDPSLFEISKMLISLRSQYRFSQDVLAVLKLLKGRVENPFSHALIFGFYNQYADLASTGSEKSDLLNHFMSHCQKWLKGMDPATSENTVLNILYPDKKEWNDIEKKTARMLIMNTPAMFMEKPGSDRELMKAFKSVAPSAKIRSVYLHPFSDESHLLGRKIPRKNQAGFEYGYGEILRTMEAARKNPKEKHILLFKNTDPLEPGIRTLMQEILRLREIRDTNLPEFMKLPDNMQIIFTMDHEMDLEDDSFMDRLTVKKIAPSGPVPDKRLDLSVTWSDVKTVRVEKGILILPHAQIPLGAGFTDLTTENLGEELYKRLELVLDEDTVLMLEAMQMSVEKGETILRIEGSSGVGKTFTARQFATLTGRKFSSNPVSQATDISEYIGFYEQDESTGRFHFNIRTAFREILEKGGVIALSEINALVDNNDKVSLSWWLEQLAEAEPDSDGYKTIYLSEIPTTSVDFDPDKLEKIRVHPKALVIADTNPEAEYTTRGAFPEIFDLNTASVRVGEFIRRENRQSSIRRINLGKIENHLEFFLKSDWKIQGQVIAKGITQRGTLTTLRQKAAMLFNTMVQAYLEGEIGSEETVIFTKRELKRFSEDILYAKTVLKKSDEDSLKYACSLHLTHRWNSKEDQQKAEKILGIHFDSAGFPEFSLSEFIRDQSLVKKRTVHMNADPKTDMTREIELIRKANPKLRIKSLPATDETNRLMLEGGWVAGDQGRLELARGVLGRMIDEALQADDGEEVMYVIENAHNIPPQEIIALNEFLQDRILKIKGKEAGRQPLNAHVLFISRMDSQVEWSQAEKSRAVPFGYHPNRNDIETAFIRRLQEENIEWAEFKTQMVEIFSGLDQKFEERYKSLEVYESHVSLTRYEQFLDEVFFVLKHFPVKDYEACFLQIHEIIDLIYIKSIQLRPESFRDIMEWYGNSLNYPRHFLFPRYFERRRREALKTVPKAAAPSTWQEKFREKQTELADETSSEQKISRARTLSRMVKEHPGPDEWEDRERINKEQLEQGMVFTSDDVKRTIGDYQKNIHASLFLSGGRLTVAGDGGEIRIWDPLEATPGDTLNGWRTIGRHPEDVKKIQALPDGKLVVLLKKGIIQIWNPEEAIPGDLESGWQTIKVPYDYSIQIHALLDGRVVVIGEYGAIQLLNPEELRPEDVLSGWTTIGTKMGMNVSVRELSDKKIIFGSSEGKIHLWNPEEAIPGDMKSGWHLIGDPGDEDSYINQIEELPDKRVLTGNRYTGEIKIWNPAEAVPGDLESGWKTIGIYGKNLTAMCKLSDGRLVATGAGGEIKIWNPAEAIPGDMESGWTTIGDYDGLEANTIQELPDGNLMIAGEGGKIYILEPSPQYLLADKEAGTLISIATGTLYNLSDISSSSVTPLEPRSERPWQEELKDKSDALADETRPKEKLRKAQAMARIVKAHPEEEVWEDKGTINKEQLQQGMVFSGAEVRKTAGDYHSDIETSSILSGGRLVVGGDSGEIRIWNPLEVKEEDPQSGWQTIGRFPDRIKEIQTLTDGKLAVLLESGDLHLWNSKEAIPDNPQSGWKPVRVPLFYPMRIQAISGGRLVVMADQGKISILNPDEIKEDDIESGWTLIGTIIGMNVSVRELSDKKIIIGSSKGKVHLWNPEEAIPGNPQSGWRLIGEDPTGQSYIMVEELPGHGVVTCNRYTGEIKLWNPEEAIPGRAQSGWRIIGNYGEQLTAMLKLSDGRLVVAGVGGKIKLWDPAEAIPGDSESGWKVLNDYDGLIVNTFQELSDGSLMAAGEGGKIRIFELTQQFLCSDKKRGKLISVNTGISYNISDIHSPSVTPLEPRSERPWQEELKEKQNRLADETIPGRKISQARRITRLVNAHPDPEEWEEGVSLNKTDLEQGMVFVPDWVKEQLIKQLPYGVAFTTQPIPACTLYPQGAIAIGGVGAIYLFDFANPGKKPQSIKKNIDQYFILSIQLLPKSSKYPQGALAVAGEGIKIMEAGQATTVAVATQVEIMIYDFNEPQKGLLPIKDKQGTAISYGEDVSVMQVLPDGRIAVAREKGEIIIYDPSRPDKKPKAFKTNYGGGTVRSMQVLKDGPLAGHIAVAGDGGQIMIYDPENLEKEPKSSGNYEEDIFSMQLLPDGRLIVAGGGGELATISLNPKCVMADKEIGSFINAETGIEHDLSRLHAEAVTLQEPKRQIPWQEELKGKQDKLTDETRPEQKLPQARSIAKIVKAHRDPEEWEEKATLNKSDLEQGMVFRAGKLQEKFMEGDGNDFTGLEILSGNRLVVRTGGRIKAYDISTKKMLPLPVSYEIHIAAIHLISENRLAVAEDTGEIRIFNLTTGKEESFYCHYGDSVKAMQLLPQNRLAVAGSGGKIKIYDLTTGNEIPFAGNYGHTVYSMQLLPDNRLAVAGVGGEIRIYDLKTGEHESFPVNYGEAVFAMCLLPDNCLGVAGIGGEIKRYDLTTEKELPSLGQYGNAVYSMLLLPDGRLCVASDGSELITIEFSPIGVMVDKDAGIFVSAQTGINYPVSSIPSDSVTILEPRSERPWQEELKEKQDKLADETRLDQKLSQAQSLARIVKAHGDPEEWKEMTTLNKTDLKEGMVFESESNFKKTIGNYGDSVQTIQELSDKRLVVAGDGGKVKIWNSEKAIPGNPESGWETIDDYGDSVLTIQELSDKRLVVAGDGGKVKIWNPEEPDKGLQSIGNYGDGVKTIQELSDKRVVVAGGKEVKIWNPEEPDKGLQSIGNYGNLILTIQKLSDKRLVIAGFGGEVKIWNPENAQPGNPE
ncbi:MAG: hypothetical protein JW774_11020, partial [Candidatus Aureabacteria bacterium]|nr:hypothetical protein [Candidatus Auribacterota bacterium]